MEIQGIDRELSTQNVRGAVMDGKDIKILPASVWRSFSKEELKKWMWETGTYVLPTEELIDCLDGLIGQEKTIEIGAGNGWIGRELDIPMTDSYQQQDDEETVLIYDLAGQPRIRYPKDVRKVDAITAVKTFRPHTVLGCYVTHKWRYDTMSGNNKGIDFQKMMRYCRRFILVGNIETHKDNPLMEETHREIELDGLLTRATDETRNRIFIWEK